MARINVGIEPKFLSDQHLIAESVEITMITGSLRRNGYQIKGKVPDKYCLGKGHINFFKPKILYLAKRLVEINNEMKLRGFNPGTSIDVFEFNFLFILNNWEPELKDSYLVRERIAERLKSPRKAKPGFHKYYKKPIEDIDDFCSKLMNSELYFV